MEQIEATLIQLLPAAATFAGAALSGAVMFFVARLVRKNRAKARGIRLSGGVRPQYKENTAKKSKRR
jgi:surfactin synthase thioesterase subunit